ncbi:hypothetical protein HRV96_26880 (plasmid) [Raoultella ornithinolytica]|uniref:hypothetical protein n=1 Tax=Raoultella ornithinolytica TaxID=54291 RepID=UPI001F42D044|nr:hypothetical protein [Raoultella ornithinolytica]UIZ76909.1 hypothetical protein HRV96_26880 [Raoultella ornithinolytica]
MTTPVSADTGNFRVAVLPPDDLIIGDYAFKVNTSTEFIYLFYARQGMEGDRAGLHRTPAANRRKLRD